MSDSYEEKTADTAKNRDRFFIESGINRFGERLKSAMEAQGITSNVKMGALCNMSDTVIGNYLIGKTYPTLDRLATLAYVLDCSPEWLLTGREVQNAEGNNNSIQTSTSNISNGLAIEFILQKLNETQQESLIQALVQHGVTGIMSALNGMADVADFLQLTENERAQVLRVFGQIREGASERDREKELVSPVTDKRQAG